MTQVAFTLTLMATVVTTIIEGLRNAFDPLPRWVWNIAAFSLGISSALIFQVNFFTDFEVTNIATIYGRVLTGLAIGGGSGVVNKLLSLISSKSQTLQAEKYALLANSPNPSEVMVREQKAALKQARTSKKR